MRYLEFISAIYHSKHLQLSAVQVLLTNYTLVKSRLIRMLTLIFKLFSTTVILEVTNFKILIRDLTLVSCCKHLYHSNFSPTRELFYSFIQSFCLFENKGSLHNKHVFQDITDVFLSTRAKIIGNIFVSRKDIVDGKE